jgi:outer membrane protein OmpA-like peptidoglycan-associated protein
MNRKSSINERRLLLSFPKFSDRICYRLRSFAPFIILAAMALFAPESWPQASRTVTNLGEGNFNTDDVIRALEVPSQYLKDVGIPPARVKGLRRSSSTVEQSQVAEDQFVAHTTKAISIQLKFDFDSAILLPESIRRLDVLSRALASERLITLKYRVIGHTDRRGGYAYNLALSEKRAEAVAGYLRGHGIAANRLITVGRSYDELVDIDSPEGAANRRVEIESVR